MKVKSVSFLVLLLSLLLSSCGAGQVLGPTLTPNPTSTNTPTLTPTSTKTPIPTVTPLPTNTSTPSPTPIPASFEEDFNSDVLGWVDSPSLLHYALEEFEYTYSKKGLEFSYALLPEQIYRGVWASPHKWISIVGDFEIEVKFDRRMRFSGILFANQNPGNRFAVLTSQGVDTDDWTKEDATLGMLIPSEGDWTWLGERSIESYIVEGDGVINLHLAFVGDEMIVSINGKEFARDKNDMYSGTKMFGGIVVGNGDHFIVESIQIWVEDEENWIFSSVN